MTNEIGQKLTEHAGEIMEWVKAVKEFSLEQAPLVCQEIIWAGTLQYGMTAAFTFLLASFSFTIAFFMGKEMKAQSKRKEEVDSTIASFVFSLTFGILFSCFTSVAVYRLLITIFAPRYYILQKLGDLL